MVFARVHLLQNPAHAGLVPSNHDEQIFHDEAHRRQFVDHFHVR
jgi:hypothetical protein